MKLFTTKTIFAQTVLILLVASSVVQAQTSTTKVAAASTETVTLPPSQSSVTTIVPEDKEAKTFSLGLGMEYSQKVVEEENGGRESSTDFTILPRYKINKNLSISAKAIVSKENSGPKNTTVSNTKVSLITKGFQINDSLKTTHGLGGTIPTNEESQKRDRLKGAVSIDNSIHLTTPVAGFEYMLSLSKNFHEYNFNAEGNANVEYRMANSLEIIVPLTDRFSISTSGIYRLGRTYGGFQRSAFEINADLNYDIVAEKLSVNLGTTNDGDAVKSNGVDSNIQAYNENTSAFRAGLTMDF